MYIETYKTVDIKICEKQKIAKMWCDGIFTLQIPNEFHRDLRTIKRAVENKAKLPIRSKRKDFK